MKPSIVPFGSNGLSLRLLEARDLPMTLAWRNRDEARKWFKTSAYITPEQHQAWFTKYSDKDDDFMFVIEAGGRPVGQASIYGINWSNKHAEIGRFLVAPEHSGQGYIHRACGELVDFCTVRLGLRYLFLEVLKANTRAVRIYKSHGFTQEWLKNDLIRMGRNLDAAVVRL